MTFTPTPEQAAIVTFIRENPEANLMVEAVAGAAKSTTIELAANDSIGPQFTPLAVTFNKRNTEDAVAKLPPHFTCKTLNALGHGAWQRARGSRKLILDDDKLYKGAKIILAADGKQSFNDKEDDTFSTILQLARAAKSMGIVPQGLTGVFARTKGLVPDHPDTWEEIAFAKGLDLTDDAIHFTRQLLLQSIDEAFRGTIDFSDQIYMSTLFGGQYNKHHTVIVDETQDLSPLNHRQLVMMTLTRLIAVGDPNQAIYAFRGADAQSMENLAEMMGHNSGHVQLTGKPGGGLIGKGKFHRMSLTKSFRVCKAVGKRQTSHVPHFGTMDWLPEGEVIRWPKPVLSSVGDSQDSGWSGEPEEKLWSIDSIPSESCWVLCRNNAPLLRLAFAFIKRRRPVKIMGRDIGASLASQLLKATGKGELPIDQCWERLDAWKRSELEKAGDSESKRDTVHDRAESLWVLLESELEANPKGTNLTCADFIKDLFSDKVNPHMTVFSSGHRAKGMEAKTILHLDPFRVPSKWARKAADHGDDRALVQELNLQYVIETRAQHTLILASLDDCLEVGE